MCLCVCVCVCLCIYLILLVCVFLCFDNVMYVCIYGLVICVSIECYSVCMCDVNLCVFFFIYERVFV